MWVSVMRNKWEHLIMTMLCSNQAPLFLEPLSWLRTWNCLLEGTRKKPILTPTLIFPLTKSRSEIEWSSQRRTACPLFQRSNLKRRCSTQSRVKSPSGNLQGSPNDFKTLTPRSWGRVSPLLTFESSSDYITWSKTDSLMRILSWKRSNSRL
jgi:hypothetical protein